MPGDHISDRLHGLDYPTVIDDFFPGMAFVALALGMLRRAHDGGAARPARGAQARDAPDF